MDIAQPSSHMHCGGGLVLKQFSELAFIAQHMAEKLCCTDESMVAPVTCIVVTQVKPVVHMLRFWPNCGVEYGCFVPGLIF